MGFIPVGKDGKQAYKYDDRSNKVKFFMWFWEKIGISIIGGTSKGKEFQFEHIKGVKKKYVNCVFKRCKFEGMKLIFIVDSYIEYDTPNPEFKNLKLCSIKNCVFKKVKPIMPESEKNDSMI